MRALGTPQLISTRLQVRLNTLRSLGTTIGPFSSTILAVLPQDLRVDVWHVWITGQF